MAKVWPPIQHPVVRTIASSNARTLRPSAVSRSPRSGIHKMSGDQHGAHRFGGSKNQLSPKASWIHRSQSIFGPDLLSRVMVDLCQTRCGSDQEKVATMARTTVDQRKIRGTERRLGKLAPSITKKHKNSTPRYGLSY
jgi:hypothetical protein